MLAKRMENKAIGNLMEAAVSHNSSIVTADCLPIIPQIINVDYANGNTSTQRMGDRINPKSLVVRGTCSIRTGTLATNQVLYVRIIIAAQKNLKTGAQVSAGVDTAHLLKPAFSGVGLSEQPFNGFTVNVDYPINRDLFKVYYDKVHRLAASGATTNSENPSGAFKWSYRFKKLPAALTFDDGNGDWANNFAPFYTVGYVYADGSTPDTIPHITTTTYSHLEFEDA